MPAAEAPSRPAPPRRPQRSSAIGQQASRRLRRAVAQSRSLGGFGSFPRATVSGSRNFPSVFLSVTSPPPRFATISVARFFPAACVGTTALARFASGLITSQLPSSRFCTMRLVGPFPPLEPPPEPRPPEPPDLSRVMADILEARVQSSRGTMSNSSKPSRARRRRARGREHRGSHLGVGDHQCLRERAELHSLDGLDGRLQVGGGAQPQRTVEPPPHGPTNASIRRPHSDTISDVSSS